MTQATPDLATQVSAIAQRAGAAIMAIYARDFAVYDKADDSPLTEADLAAHTAICQGLAEISALPVLSEESAAIAWQERQHWSAYWLVDPLDGTKEFIKKNGEFTVNIALIEHGKPTLGVVYAPVLDTYYVGIHHTDNASTNAPVYHTAYTIEQGVQRPIAIADKRSTPRYQVVGSRSHASPDTLAFIEALDKPAELVPMGSSLKLCLVATGQAHFYPRLGLTSEWDTAAAHAVVLAAGGMVKIFTSDDIPTAVNAPETLDDLVYNQKESLLNPYFLVSC